MAGRFDVSAPEITTVEAEQRRLEALSRYEVLDISQDGTFDQVAQLAARLFDAPMATVTIVDEDSIWLKAVTGFPAEVGQGFARSEGYCSSAILQDEPYVIPDALEDPCYLDTPTSRNAFGIRFYAAAPIITEDGYRLGTVNVLDTKPRQATETDLESLRGLADVVAHQLQLRLAGILAIRKQEANVHAALRSRTDTDRAIGMIMLARGCDANGAWTILRSVSQHANIKVRVIARTLSDYVAGVDTATLDPTALQSARSALTA